MRKRKTWLVSAVVLLLAAGGGYVAYTRFFAPSETAQEPVLPSSAHPVRSRPLNSDWLQPVASSIVTIAHTPSHFIRAPPSHYVLNVYAAGSRYRRFGRRARGRTLKNGEVRTIMRTER